MSTKCFNFGRKKPTIPTETKLAPTKFELNHESFANQQQHGYDNAKLDEFGNNQLELYERTGFVGTKDYRKPIPSGFELANVRYFLGQDASRIRRRTERFDDPFFLKYVCSIVENTSSLLFLSLKARLRATHNDLDELNHLIKWFRIEVRNDCIF